MSARFRAARPTALCNRRNVIERGVGIALVAEGEAGAVLPLPPVRPTTWRPSVPLQAPGNTARVILLPPAAAMQRGEQENYPRNPRLYCACAALRRAITNPAQHQF